MCKEKIIEVNKLFFTLKKLLSLNSKMGYLTSILLTLSVLVSLSICVEKARFDFYRVYEVTASDESHLRIFQQILDNPDGVRILYSANVMNTR